MYVGVYVKYLLFLSDFKEKAEVPNILMQIINKNSPTIRPVGAKLFHSDRQTDMMNVAVEVQLHAVFNCSQIPPLDFNRPLPKSNALSAHRNLLLLTSTSNTGVTSVTRSFMLSASMSFRTNILCYDNGRDVTPCILVKS